MELLERLTLAVAAVAVKEPLRLGMPEALA